MAWLAGTTLLWRGTALDRLWVLNRPAHEQLILLGPGVGAIFLLLGAVLGAAGVGWFLRRPWGWRLAVAILVIQGFGDLANLLRGDFLRGGVGFTIAGLLLLYLLRRGVRSMFSGDKPSLIAIGSEGDRTNGG